ncbi:hypothetical protein, partial [Acinetobacter baumannii]
MCGFVFGFFGGFVVFGGGLCFGVVVVFVGGVGFCGVGGGGLLLFVGGVVFLVFVGRFCVFFGVVDVVV